MPKPLKTNYGNNFCLIGRKIKIPKKLWKTFKGQKFWKNFNALNPTKLQKYLKILS